MAITLTRYGAQYLATQGLGDHDLQLKLWENNFTLTYNKASPACFDEPNVSSGYALATIYTTDWFSTYATGSHATNCIANASSSGNVDTPYVFTFDGSTPTSAVYIRGYYVTINANWPDTGEEWVLWAENFGQPFEVSDTGKDHIDIVVQMEIA